MKVWQYTMYMFVFKFIYCDKDAMLLLHYSDILNELVKKNLIIIFLVSLWN